MINSKYAYAKKAILLGLCTLFLSACYPTGEQSSSIGDEGTVMEYIDNIESDNNHLEIDVNLPEIANEISKINVKREEQNIPKEAKGQRKLNVQCFSSRKKGSKASLEAQASKRHNYEIPI